MAESAKERGGERSNAWVSKHLRELAVRFELEGDPHRPRAYRRAAETVEELGRPIAQIFDEGGASALDALPGIGPHIARLLGELLRTGEIRKLERLRAKAPIDLDGLLAIEGLGPKTLRTLWKELGVRTVDDLERALEEGRVQELPGFGARREARLREALRLSRRGGRRFRLAQASKIAQRLRTAIARSPKTERCEIAGSIRRRHATVGDIDLVAASEDAESVADVLLGSSDVEYVYSRGPHRVSVRLAAGIDVDLRIVPASCFGSALLYFTGNRSHTVNLRRLALAQGLRLNEYGLFRDGERVAGETEEGIYEALSLPWIPPERRVGGNEIRAALRSAKP